MAERRLPELERVKSWQRKARHTALRQAKEETGSHTGQHESLPRIGYTNRVLLIRTCRGSRSCVKNFRWNQNPLNQAAVSGTRAVIRRSSSMRWRT